MLAIQISIVSIGLVYLIQILTGIYIGVKNIQKEIKSKFGWEEKINVITGNFWLFMIFFIPLLGVVAVLSLITDSESKIKIEYQLILKGLIYALSGISFFFFLIWSITLI